RRFGGRPSPSRACAPALSAVRAFETRARTRLRTGSRSSIRCCGARPLRRVLLATSLDGDRVSEGQERRASAAETPAPAHTTTTTSVLAAPAPPSTEAAVSTNPIAPTPYGVRRRTQG